MQDEYGDMTAEEGNLYYTHPGPFQLESGQILPEAKLCYHTYGTLNKARNNVLVVCHALTGNAALHVWWSDMMGSGKVFDVDKYFIVCCNILGSCYGSTNPNSMNRNEDDGEEYGVHFPDVSVQDTVRLQLLLLRHELKLSSVLCVVGGSFGGMQTLEYVVQAGSGSNPFIQSAVVIACGTSHTAWQIGISEVQRQAIYADPQWSTNPKLATSGLAVARQIGMVSYRTPQGYRSHFGRRIMPSNPSDKRNSTRDKQQQDSKSSSKSPQYGSRANWSVKSYLQYQGQKFLPRFDPVTYVKLTEQMDSHDITRGRCDGKSANGSDVAHVLGQVHIPVLVMGIDSDVLYPLEEQEGMAELLPNGELVVIHSEDGHDGFLIEQDQMARHIGAFLELRQKQQQRQEQELLLQQQQQQRRQLQETEKKQPQFAIMEHIMKQRTGGLATAKILPCLRSRVG